MSSADPNAYFVNEVFTASPQKLRLMLIDGCIRYLNETKEHWNTNRFDLGGESIDRARAIVTELISSINRDALPEITTRLVDLYAYVFKALVDAGLTHDQKMIDDVLRVLLIERDTWKIICETMSAQHMPAPHINHARHAAPIDLATDYQGGFSVEA